MRTAETGSGPIGPEAIRERQKILCANWRTVFASSGRIGLLPIGDKPMRHLAADDAAKAFSTSPRFTPRPGEAWGGRGAGVDEGRERTIMLLVAESDDHQG